MSTIPILSAIAKYDDLMRCQRELTSSAAEESFFLFLQQYELTRLEYQKVIDEAKDLQRQLDAQTHQTIAFEKQLNHARKLLEDERKKRREAEFGKEQVEEKLVQLREVLLNDHTIKDETRKHLATLNNYGTHKKRKSLHNQEDYGNEINSTGSFLSDLSLTQSEDDFLDSRVSGPGQKWKKHRPSYNNNTSLLNASAKKTRKSTELRRSTRQSLIEYGPNDKIVAQTKVSIPQDKRKPICAESIIESIPSNNYQNHMPSIPSATTSSSSADMQWKQKESKEMYKKYDEFKMDEAKDPFKTPMKKKQMEQKTPSTKFYTPSAPSLDDLNKINDNPDIYATVKKKTRPHTFTPKTFLKPETCAVCQKKIRFGSVAFKCGDCRTCVHQDCRDKLSVTCIPQSANTPVVKSGQLGNIGDYCSNIAPMVPALIVHCVNEIETRGLHELGLYRVSGSEREVKALKEKFLRNKGVPFLSNVDIHVLCGCIKDFLRSLREPLIPIALWTIFSNASQATPDDEHEINQEIHKAIRLLPQPNRDTLAYLIQHFQRIAECPEVKMPLTNFSKIFGPTIVGYSCADPDQHMMFAETQIQFAVMFALVSIPTDFWNRFVNLDGVPRLDDMNGFENYGSKFYSGTPSLKINRKERKFYATPPYPSTVKSKK